MKSVPLGDVVDILDNMRIPINSAERVKRQGSVPYYGATGQVGTIDKALFNETLILLGEDGVPFFDSSKHKAYEISGPSWVNNHAHVLRAKSELVIQRYLLHFLNGFNYSGYVNGATRLKLTQGDMRRIPIPLPTLEKQRELVDKLDKSFTEMDLLENNLSVQKSALTEISSGKLDQIFSRKDELDKDVHQVKLSDIARVINGRAYSQPELLKQGPYPVLRVGNFFSNRGWYYSDLELDKDKYCDNGDLLYAWSASFGPRIWDGGKVIYHYHIWKIEEKKELVLRDWLYWWFLWDVKQIKEAHGTGSTMMHVTKGAMENRLVELPSIEVQAQQIREIAELQLSTQKLESNYKILEENHSSLRSAVIASAFKEAVA